MESLAELGGSLVSGSSSIGAGSSGFARLGSSSDPKSGFGGGLTSFAPQDGTSIFASKQVAKPFGAPDDDVNASEGGDDDGAGTSLRRSKDDSKFSRSGEKAYRMAFVDCDRCFSHDLWLTSHPT